MHHRVLIRSACRAHNAYNPALALRAAFGTATRRCDSSTGVKDEPLPSQWESTNWEPLQTNPLPESPRRPEPELIEEEESAIDGQASTDVEFDSAIIRRAEVHIKKRGTLEPDEWQNRIKLLSDTLNEISDRKHNPDNERTRVRKGVFNYMPHNVSTRRGDLKLPIPWRLPENSNVNINNVTNEIYRFAIWAEPTENERAARKAVADETMETVYSALGKEEKDRVCMELQGSEKTGLALPWSDIDIRIWDGGDPPPPWHLSAPRLLRKLGVVGEAMRNSDKWTEIEVRDSFYPILVAHHKDSGIDIQIVASLDTHAQEAVVSKYLQEMPYLRSLFVLVRTFFSMRNFNNVFTGGLGSYGIFVLLVAVLRRLPPERSASRHKIPLKSLQYEAMKNFFAALAPGPNEQKMKIDLTNLGLSCFAQGRFKKHNFHPDLPKYSEKALDRGDRIRAGQWRIGHKNYWVPELLCLQDPANPNNDLGRKTYAIKHILASMNYASMAFKKIVFGKFTKKSKLLPEDSLLYTYIGKPHEVYHDQRAKLEAYGKKFRKMRSFVVDGHKIISFSKEQRTKNRNNRRNRRVARQKAKKRLPARMEGEAMGDDPSGANESLSK